MRTAVALWFLAIILAAAHPACWAQTLPSETERLLSTGRLWITVKYFDPAISSRHIDWDQALVAALPAVRAAQTPAEYKAAIEDLMRAIPAAAPPSGGSSIQRLVFHRGFAPEPAAADSPFYSAFLYKAGANIEEVSVPMGAGFSIQIPLSEPATPDPLAPVSTIQSAPDPAYPSTELRILAAYKIWGILHYFFAYRDLLDEDWDALFAQFLPRLIAAKDALEYNLAIAEWLTHAADTYTAPHSATLAQYFGEASVGLRLRIIEKHVVVTQVLDPAATQAGIKIGDIIKKVDGENLVDRFKRQEQYTPASTPQRLAADVVENILNGADDSRTVLTIEDFRGTRKEVTLKRSKTFLHAAAAQPAGESFKLLRSGIGYADLRLLKHTAIDSMFDLFAHAPAIIFDMRGTPADEETAAAVAARLTSTNEPTAAAIITGPLVTTPDLPRETVSNPSASFFFLEALPNSPAPKFKGHTIMLVDERTISSGERAALYFEAANKTEFVGSPTAGALSTLTQFTVPGAITITFSGQDIRHGNSGKLQRLGIQPNVTITPTLGGVRNAKDEVLEKALDSVAPKPFNTKPLPTRAFANSFLVFAY